MSKRISQVIKEMQVAQSRFGDLPLYLPDTGIGRIEYRGKLYDIRGKHVRGPWDLKPLDHRRDGNPQLV